MSLFADAPNDTDSVEIALPLMMAGPLHDGVYEAYAASQIDSPLLAGRSPIAGGSTTFSANGTGEAQGCFELRLTKVPPENAITATGTFHISCGADCP